MTYENIQINKPNFCIGPQAGTFCFVDTTGENAVMRVRNNSGDPISTYTFYPQSILDVDADSGNTIYNKVERIAYVGPTELTGYNDNLQFYTLEREIINGDSDYSSKATIRRWLIDSANSYLRLVETFIKQGEFNSYAFAIEKRTTTFADNTPAETGLIEMTTTSGLNKYDVLMLGPSTDIDSLHPVTGLGRVEYCYVQLVSGTHVYINHLDYTPPKYEFDGGDPITIRDRGFLFSNVGTASNPTSAGGRIYELDLNDDGNTVSGIDSAAYANVKAARWSEAYNTLTFVKNTNLLILALNDYEVIKSMFLSNIRADERTVITIEDIDFNNIDIYRLQDKTVKKDDNWLSSDYSWSGLGPYNYQLDTFIPYTSSVELHVSPERYLIQDQTVELIITARDQFGIPILGKKVYFSKSGDNDAAFVPPGATDETDSDGHAKDGMEYKSGNNYFGDSKVNVKVDGSSVGIRGSEYVWCKDIIIKTRCYLTESHGSNFLEQIIEGSENTEIIQVEEWLTPIIVIDQISAFSAHLPEDIIQKLNKTDTVKLDQIITDNLLQLTQQIEVIDTLFVDQLYISRHYGFGHQDDIDIEQFVFIENARPVFWSEKNPVDTDIWLRLNPYAFSLNIETLKIQIKEASYAGIESWRDITSQGTSEYFGTEPFGIEFSWTNPTQFHYNGIVYVRIEVYDTAPIPNIIITEYWFRLIPDFRKPYLINLSPEREEYDVNSDTGIYFEIKDNGAGVDIDTLEFNVNNRVYYPDTTRVSRNHYLVYYNPTNDFKYGDEVSVSVSVNDDSVNNNRLVDYWRFYIKDSYAPWFDAYHYRPRRCAKGMPRSYNGVVFQVYDGGNGVDRNSIEVYVGQKDRRRVIEPIVYREG